MSEDGEKGHKSNSFKNFVHLTGWEKMVFTLHEFGKGCSFSLISTELSWHWSFVSVVALTIEGITGNMKWAQNSQRWLWWFSLVFHALSNHACCVLSGTLVNFLLRELRFFDNDLLFQFNSIQFSCSVVSDSLRPHELQHARLPCPSPTLRVYPNSCP